MKHQGSCAIEADATKIRPRLVNRRGIPKRGMRRGGHKISNRTATLFTFGRLMVIYNRAIASPTASVNAMKRGWGYENENLRSGRNAYGVCIAVRERDQVWRAAVVAACLVSAAAIAIGVLVGGRG